MLYHFLSTMAVNCLVFKMIVNGGQVFRQVVGDQVCCVIEVVIGYIALFTCLKFVCVT